MSENKPPYIKAADNGGPAYPVSTADSINGHQDGSNTWRFPGMTLLDVFAAARPAPQDMSIAWGESVIGRPMPKLSDGSKQEVLDMTIRWWMDVEAEWSYRQAEALIAAKRRREVV